MKKMKRSIISGQPIERLVEFDRAAINAEERTAELSFSSEEEIEHWFGAVILDHSAKSVRLKRLNKGGALLMDHEPTDQVGVIEKAFIGTDRKGRAVVRFGKSQRAEEIFQDVQDGIRRNVSVTVHPYKMVLEKEEKDTMPVYRATDWEPMEVSIVSVPRDITVGINRSAHDSKDIEIEITREIDQKEDSTMKICSKCGKEYEDGKQCACEVQAPAQRSVDLEAVREAARTKEMKRSNEILAIGEKHKLSDLARAAITAGTTVDEFKTQVLEKISNAVTIEVMDPPANPKPFKNFGEQLRAVMMAARAGEKADDRLMVLQRASGLNEAIPSEGGFLVQQDFTMALLQKVEETGILAPKCTRIPIGEGANGIKAPIVDESSRATGSRWGGVQVYRVNEAATATAKKPKMAMLDLRLEKLMGICYATEEMLADVTALGSIITQAFTEEFGFKIDDEIVRGTGAGECLGILTANCLVTQAKETGQAADTVIAENIMKMYSRMWARGVSNATWYINQEVWPQLFQMSVGVGTGGVPVFMPPNGLSQAPFGTLFGRPVQPIEQASALGDAGDVIFADMSQYVMIERDGLNASSSIHVKFVYDEQTFKFTLRNNGQPIWTSAKTPYKGSATVSPFVTLIARA